MSKYCDISNEFLIQPFKSGIKLCKPDYQNGFGRILTVQNIMNIQISTYFMHDDSIFRANEECMSFMDMEPREVEGRTVDDIPNITVESKYNLIKINQDILNTENLQIIEEELIFENDLNLMYLSIKMPFYNENSYLTGIFGCSIAINYHSLIDSLKKIYQLGILSNNFSEFLLPPKQQIPLSKRESQILYHLVKGKSARETGLILNLSSRTIEDYIDKIKHKMKVNSKSMLVEKGLEYFGIFF